MKHFLAALGAFLCLACFFSPIQAETSNSSQTKISKAPVKVTGPVYCDVITVEPNTHYPPVSLDQPSYPLHLGSIKLASVGGFSLDKINNILTVNKAGIYKVNFSIRVMGTPFLSSTDKMSFSSIDLALAGASGPLEHFRVNLSPLTIQAILGADGNMTFYWSEVFAGSQEVLLSLPQGTKLRLNVEQSPIEFGLSGDAFSPGLHLVLVKVADLPV